MVLNLNIDSVLSFVVTKNIFWFFLHTYSRGNLGAPVPQGMARTVFCCWCFSFRNQHQQRSPTNYTPKDINTSTPHGRALKEHMPPWPQWRVSAA